MNKVLIIIKNILLILNVCLIFKYLSSMYYDTLVFFIYFVLLLFITIISIKDLIQKNDMDIKYNFSYILLLLISNLVIIRALYDPSFIYNSSSHMKLIAEEFTRDELKVINFNYLYQNLPYLILIISLLIIYRMLNLKKKKDSKYSLISLSCFFISICTIIPTLETFSGSFGIRIGYLIFNIILIGTEIFELIRNNHRKREWIIYISFLFNLFAIISIFV